MKILVTGVNGQLGHDVIEVLTARGITCKGVDIADFDLTNQEAVSTYIRDYAPTAVIHCAAFTAVDRSEDDKELCFAVNVTGTENIARICREIQAKMVYISTDYVFDGKGDQPFETDAPKDPQGHYGRTKSLGEDKVREYLSEYFIVRTAWVFGINGNNFVKTMIRLGKERDELNVVADQFGSPTFSADLAVLLCDMIVTSRYGIYHATNEGFCSWYDFASAIMKEAGLSAKVLPVTSEQYPSKAVRPKNSRLSKKSLDDAGFNRLPTWQDALKRYVAQLH
ncbi:MAG: dTDP-4-dehydrorhamnose reductase [Eubacteriales bacterium]